MIIGVTGSKGFIGKRLVNELLFESHHVIEYDKNLLSWGTGTDFEEFRQCDLIINLAGKNKGTDSEIIKTNVFAVGNLLEWCFRYSKKIMFAGTDYKKDGAYKHSKDTIKALCRSYVYAGSNIDPCILNIPKVIGPGCKPNYNSFVTTLIWAQATDQLKIYENKIIDLDEKLELIHVNDLCESIIDLIKYPASGYTEYEFTKYDGKFSITMKEILESIKGNNVHPFSGVLQDLVKWYRDQYDGD